MSDEEVVLKDHRNPAFEIEELQVMVDVLQRNAAVLFGEMTPVWVKNQIWVELAEAVSAVGPCPRSEIDVKKRWQDLKVHVRKLAAQQKRSAAKTGGGPPCKIKLRAWEQVCLSLMDADALEGVGTPDYGTPGMASGAETSGSQQGTQEPPQKKRRSASAVTAVMQTPAGSSAAPPQAPAQPLHSSGSQRPVEARRTLATPHSPHLSTPSTLVASSGTGEDTEFCPTPPAAETPPPQTEQEDMFTLDLFVWLLCILLWALFIVCICSFIYKQKKNNNFGGKEGGREGGSE